MYCSLDIVLFHFAVLRQREKTQEYIPFAMLAVTVGRHITGQKEGKIWSAKRKTEDVQ